MNWFPKMRKERLEETEEMTENKPASPSGDRPRMLNLGCGAHFHPDWVNLDVVPSQASVIRHDLEAPLPFEDESCAAVYHSHVLEHLARERAPGFLGECARVLAPGGVLRVVVPDLETIARLYLRCLDGALDGDQPAAQRHEWMTLELLDQMVRERTGGRMLEYWKQNPMPVEDFVYERLGWEARRFVEKWREQQHPANGRDRPQAPTPEEITRFRQSGEVHRWMYDRISLAALLKVAGFSDCGVCSAVDSRIENFVSYCLDADAGGTVRKPDSLFFEAVKPASVV